MSKLINHRDMHRSMRPILADRALAQHPCGQVELAPNRNGSVAFLLLMYATVSRIIKVKSVDAHHDMDPHWHKRGLRCIIRLLRLVKTELPQRDLSSREIHTVPAVVGSTGSCPLVVSVTTWNHRHEKDVQGLLSLHVHGLVYYWRQPC